MYRYLFVFLSGETLIIETENHKAPTLTRNLDGYPVVQYMPDGYSVKADEVLYIKPYVPPAEKSRNQ